MPALASAQSPSSDPESGSPPGVIYELPVESGREDAAPRRGSGDEGRSQRRGGSGSGGVGPGGGGGVSGSAGSADGGQGGGGSGGDSSRDGAEDSRGGDEGDDDESSDGSPLRSENGFGSSSEVPGLDEGSTRPATDAARAPGGLGTGSIVAIALLAMVVLAGIALGVARQGRSRG
jgi:hypothetical protein